MHQPSHAAGDRQSPEGRPDEQRCYSLPPPDAGEPIAWNAAVADAACDCGVPGALGIAQGERAEAGDPGATPRRPVTGKPPITSRTCRRAIVRRSTPSTYGIWLQNQHQSFTRPRREMNCPASS